MEEFDLVIKPLVKSSPISGKTMRITGPWPAYSFSQFSERDQQTEGTHNMSVKSVTEQDVTLCDLLDRLLYTGVVVQGDGYDFSS